MTTEIPLKCQCGKVTGCVKNASPHNGNHVVCMCIDCQTYAHHLNSEELLDENGGTAIYQTTPKNVVLNSGQEHIKLLKLTPKGADRFYASCCNTPIANTLSGKMAFIGLPTAVLDFDAIQSSSLQTIGEVTDRCMAKYGYGEIPKSAHPGFPLLLTLKIMKQILVGKISKSYRPSAFYDDETQAPIAKRELIDKTLKQSIVEKISSSK